MQIFVSGSLAYDRIMDFPGRFAEHILPEKLHVLNVSFMVNGLTENFGGTAGNIAYSLSLMNERPLILASVGRDFDRYAQWLDDHGLNQSGIRIIEDDVTGGAYITTDLADNQITGFNPGAMKFSTDYDFSDVDVNDCIGIISPGNLEDMIGYAHKYKELGIPYIVDPGQQIPVLTGDQMKEMVNGSMMLVSNDYELEMIEKATKLSRSELLARTDIIVTTLGEQGSRIHSGGKTFDIPAAKADKVIDPTGAGDAHRAGLISGLSQGRSIKEAGQMGSVSASFAVEHYGTQDHKFTSDQFQERYEATFGR